MVYFNGFHRYIPVIAKMQGFQVREIPVGHAARMHGISKYGWGRLPNVLRQIALLRIRPRWLVEGMVYKLRVLPSIHNGVATKIESYATWSNLQLWQFLLASCLRYSGPKTSFFTLLVQISMRFSHGIPIFP
jgi:hypothetical protein